MSTLESELLTLKARLDIADLIHRYALAVDQKNVDELVSLYAPNGVFERIQKSIQGHDDLREFYTGMVSRYHPTRHLPSVHVITELGSDSARGVATGTAELGEHGLLFRAAYRVEDSYIRLDGTWLFEHRSLRYMYVVQYPDLDGVFRSEHRIRWPNLDPMPGHFE